MESVLNRYLENYDISFNNYIRQKRIYITTDISDESILELNNEKDDTLIIITFVLENGFDNYDTSKSYRRLNEIISKLNLLDRKFTIKIKVENRENFNKEVTFLNHNNKHDILINTDSSDYTIEEYLSEEKYLESLIEHIKFSSLSPFEKYMAVYEIVKNYKPYCEDYITPSFARKLKYILYNDTIVCIGYVKLLNVLLEKVGIHNENYGTSIYSINDKNNNVNECGDHERLIVSIDDDKYDIHGYYVADPTLDNKNSDYYVNALITFDSMQECIKLFSLNMEDYFLDIHSLDEFIEKINTLYNHTIRNNKTPENNVKAFNIIVCNAIELFKNLDEELYRKLIDMYNEPTINNYEKYTNILIIIGNHLVERVNKPVNNDKIINSILTGKCILQGKDKQELEEYKNRLIKINSSYFETLYPYNTTENKLLIKKCN